MRKIILLLIVLIPLFARSQSKTNFLTENIVRIDTDFYRQDFKANKKETVHRLRQYLEKKDNDLDQVNSKIIAVNEEMNANFVDDSICSKFVRKVKLANSTQKLDEEAINYLRQLGYPIDISAGETYADISGIVNKLNRKIITRSVDDASLVILNNSRTNITKDIYQAHQRIDELYNSLYDEGKFRLEITILFSTIIGVLLLFFFLFITYKSETALAKDFLASGNGLQFIALFSLIIAIILFGVMGILEGRELAAILSGISGYILGKGIAKPKPENGATDTKKTKTAKTNTRRDADSSVTKADVVENENTTENEN